MAKGRSLTTSRSERYLGNSYNYGDNQGNRTVAETSEFGEEDVWSMVEGGVDDGRDGHHHHHTSSDWSSHAEVDSNGGTTMGMVNNQTRMPKDRHHRHQGGLSLAFEDSSRRPMTPSSSRIVHQFRSRQQHDGELEGNHGSGGGGGGRNHQHHRRQMATSAPVNVPDWNRILRVNSVESLHDSDDSGSDDYYSSFTDYPPHEYLARSRKTGTTSVFEGVGRTLKGRDLSRLRDAVWSQTGFDG